MAAGDLVITFAEGTLDSPWLAEVGFAAVPFTVTKDAGGNLNLSVQTEEKGATLKLNLAITGSRNEVMKGTLVHIEMTGATRTWTVQGEVTDPAGK